MSDDNAPARPYPDISKRPTRAADSALASSIPDPNTIVLGLIKLLMRVKGIGRLITLPGGVVAIWLVIFCIVGVPAMLAMSNLIDKYIDLRRDEKQAGVEVERARASSITDEIMQGIKGIDGKISQQGEQIDQLGRDVGALKGAQTATDRKLQAVQAEQRRQRESAP